MTYGQFSVYERIIRRTGTYLQVLMELYAFVAQTKLEQLTFITLLECNKQN